MACPNCDDERVQRDDVFNNWFVKEPEAVFCIEINFCPFCGEQLLSPSQACSRGQG